MPTNQYFDSKTILRIRRTLEKIYNNNLVQTHETTLIARILAKIIKTQNSVPNDDKAYTKLYNMDDIMKMLGISKSTYSRLRNSGELKPTKVGGRDYYRQEDIDRILSQIYGIKKSGNYQYICCPFVEFKSLF